MHNQSLSIHNQCLSKITIMRWNEIKIVVQAVFNPDFRSVASFKQTKSWTHVEAHPSWEKEIKATNQPRSETSGRKSGWDCIEEGSSHGLYRCQKTWVQLNFVFFFLLLCLCQSPEQLAWEICWVIVRSERWSKMRIEHCPKGVLDAPHLWNSHVI